MTDDGSFSGQLGIIEHRAFWYLANQYDPIEGIAQGAENSGDACILYNQTSGKSEPGKIWVVIRSDGVVEIIDTGLGMMAWFDDPDAPLMEEYLSSDLKFDDDELRQAVTRRTRHSLQWMANCVALSAKIDVPDPVDGVMGIGALAWMTYGETATIFSRPAPELARAKKTKTFYLRWPERNSRDMTYEIGDGTGQLVDPWGNLLQHGSRLVVSGVDINSISALKRPATLVDYLRMKFGAKIAAGLYSITVVDMVTAAGQATRGGRILKVTPQLVLGTPVISETLVHQTGHESPIALFLPNNPSDGVMVRHHGTDKFPVHRLAEFDDGIWRSLTGWITFPVFDNDEGQLLPSKQGLRNTAERRMWSEDVRQLEQRIIQAIRDAERNQHTGEVRKYGQNLSAAIKNALADFGYDPIGAARKSRIEGTRAAQKQKGSSDRTKARVVDEHGQPVIGVRILLSHRGGEQIGNRETGLTGIVSFGPLERGAYTFTLMLPEGMEAPRGCVVHFNILPGNEQKKRYYHTFELITGRSIQEGEPNLRAVNVVFAPLESGRPYEQRLDVGVLTVNTGWEPLEEALAKEDDRRICGILAECAAGAIVEHRGETGDIGFAIYQMMELSANIAEYLLEHNFASPRRKRRRR